MAAGEILESDVTALLVFEAFVTFAVFGAYLGVFWILSGIPQISFSLEAFLNQYGAVFFLGLVIVRIGDKVMQKAMQGL